MWRIIEKESGIGSRVIFKKKRDAIKALDACAFALDRELVIEELPMPTVVEVQITGYEGLQVERTVWSNGYVTYRHRNSYYTLDGGWGVWLHGDGEDE